MIGILNFGTDFIFLQTFLREIINEVQFKKLRTEIIRELYTLSDKAVDEAFLRDKIMYVLFF